MRARPDTKRSRRSEGELRLGRPHPRLERATKASGDGAEEQASPSHPVRWGGAILDTARKARTSGGRRLRIEHRLTIAVGICANLTHGQIAHGIGFSRTTVGREIARHGGRDDYDPYLAQMRADRDARRPKARKIDESSRVRGYVLEKLSQRWSPMQISTTMKEDFPDDEEMRVSHEAITRPSMYRAKGRCAKSSSSKRR